MLTVCIILSVMASLVSFTALGRFPPPGGGLPPKLLLAMFCRVSLFSLKNFSMLSLSLIILSVIINLLSAESAPALLSVLADEAEFYLLLSVAPPSSLAWWEGILTFLRLFWTVFGLSPVSWLRNWMVSLA